MAWSWEGASWEGASWEGLVVPRRCLYQKSTRPRKWPSPTRRRQMRSEIRRQQQAQKRTSCEKKNVKSIWQHTQDRTLDPAHREVNRVAALSLSIKPNTRESRRRCIVFSTYRKGVGVPQITLYVGQILFRLGFLIGQVTASLNHLLSCQNRGGRRCNQRIGIHHNPTTSSTRRFRRGRCSGWRCKAWIARVGDGGCKTDSGGAQEERPNGCDHQDDLSNRALHHAS